MAGLREHLLLFDFDGVMVDSRPAAFAYMKRYNPGMTPEEHLALFEGNIYETEKEFEFGPDGEFWADYSRNLLQTPPIPGIATAIEDLEDRYSMLVISSSFSGPIRSYLDQHELSKYFVEIMGGDVHKSKVEKIKMVLEKYEATASDCLFITDTLGDLREANHMKVPAIAVTWGFHSIETLQKGNPSRIAETPGLMVDAIDQHFANHTS